MGVTVTMETRLLASSDPAPYLWSLGCHWLRRPPLCSLERTLIYLAAIYVSEDPLHWAFSAVPISQPADCLPPSLCYPATSPNPRCRMPSLPRGPATSTSCQGGHRLPLRMAVPLSILSKPGLLSNRLLKTFLSLFCGVHHLRRLLGRWVFGWQRQASTSYWGQSMLHER